MKNQLRKIGILLCGILILTFGIALFIKATMGADPFTTFNLGLSEKLHISFAGVQVIVNMLILGGVLLINKKYISIGTLISMLTVGPLIEINITLLNQLTKHPLTKQQQMIFLIAGCFILSIGAGIYIAANIGVGPYDIIPLLIEEKKIASFKVTRMLLDLGCVILGNIMGATIGIGTLIAALWLGPLIEYFRKLAKKHIVKE
ncbi:MAG: YczE/YyaS/YitT family protein [Cellulosilyticaceae bacterium]